jgi:hypothetical protein
MTNISCFLSYAECRPKNIVTQFLREDWCGEPSGEWLGKGKCDGGDEFDWSTLYMYEESILKKSITHYGL